MARLGANGVVNAAALVQGVTLVTVPAASSILTSPSDYGLSSSQYGNVFLPQVVAAIAAARCSGPVWPRPRRRSGSSCTAWRPTSRR